MLLSVCLNETAWKSVIKGAIVALKHTREFVASTYFQSVSEMGHLNKKITSNLQAMMHYVFVSFIFYQLFRFLHLLTGRAVSNSSLLEMSDNV